VDRLRRHGARQSFFGSKLYSGALSPGCSTCSDSAWSCVYLTGQCTAGCSFCPITPGIETSLPHASGVAFYGLEAYLAFLRFAGFRGVSFSSGSPLLRFEETLAWIARIKQEGPDRYVWMYTNGDLVDKGRLNALRETGLDEIRINIRARDYALGPVALTRAAIPTVTVEIPVIPEECEVLRERIVELHWPGVDHLNLHQLFVNQANYLYLAGRGYSLLPLIRSSFPVLESELCALRLMSFTLEN
jgi:pyruvate formate-lyase activating enzyme-like uncharacterized protein